MRGIHGGMAGAGLRLAIGLALALAAGLALLAPGPLAAKDPGAAVNGPGVVPPSEHGVDAAPRRAIGAQAPHRAGRTRATEQRRIDEMSPTRWLARFGRVAVDRRD
jgi:hypothetical protein